MTTTVKRILNKELTRFLSGKRETLGQVKKFRVTVYDHPRSLATYSLDGIHPQKPIQLTYKVEIHRHRQTWEAMSVEGPRAYHTLKLFKLNLRNAIAQELECSPKQVKIPKEAYALDDQKNP